MTERDVNSNPDFEPFEDTLDTETAETTGTPEAGQAPGASEAAQEGDAPKADEAAEAPQAAPSAEAERPAGDRALEDEIAKLRHERDEYYNKLLRATADYRNSQRRLEAEKDQAVQYANSALIKELLPVIDNFERGLAVDPEKTDVPSLLQGMQMVHDELMRVLKKQNVEEVAPQPGDAFDPELHNALMQQPSEEYKVPTVLQLLQKGYTHHGRTLRPAGVVVSRSE